ncbi:TIGR00282 family metallophosphoesterase [Candidatus Falkowbacteria bacterium]|nr:MAG: TIGR00282 family metallophosphoesterase [Candidatus Falkowbacteria bacterium]
MLNILFIGDIVGKIGRKTIAKVVPKLKKEYKINFVIANAENSAHGSGVTAEIIAELESYGIDCFTTGDHAFKNKKNLAVFDKENIIRPANFSPAAQGKGYMIIDKQGKKILVINLIGRVFMQMNHDCPFQKIDEILANINLPLKKLSAIIVDIHAEASSEKVSLGHYLNGRVSAILGTHTHIMTADHKITSQGTAYITDAGMVGAHNSCLGLDKENIIKTFLTQIKYQHVIPEKGKTIFNGVILKVNSRNSQALSIKPIIQYVNIK